MRCGRAAWAPPSGTLVPMRTPPESQPRERWGIVGGGVLGMTLAHRLARAGRRVTLYEAADTLGGLASPWTIGDVVWDRHYHVTLMSDRYLRRLLAELRLDEEMEWVETRTGFYTGGRLLSMSNSIEFLRFPPLGLLDKLRLAANILYASRVRDWRRLEGVSAEDWLRRWSGGRTFEKIWLPLLRSKLGDSYRKTSAAFIWATIARMYEARRTGLKKEMFGYVPGGYARILARSAELLASEGVRIELDRPTRRVERCDGGTVVVESTDGGRDELDHVVVTAPAPLAATLCPQLSEDEKTRLRGVHYQGVICASLLSREPLSPYYVTNITDAGMPFTAVIEASAFVDRRHFGGHALIYLPRYVPPDDPAFSLTDQEIEDSFLSALARMHRHFDRRQVVSFRVSRVRHVFALTTLHYSRRLPPLTTSVPGIHVVNSAHVLNGTLTVNATLRLAESAARGLLSEVPHAEMPDS
jgi:protoporphyrinogen oxidase